MNCFLKRVSVFWPFATVFQAKASFLHKSTVTFDTVISRKRPDFIFLKPGQDVEQLRGRQNYSNISPADNLRAV